MPACIKLVGLFVHLSVCQPTTRYIIDDFGEVFERVQPCDKICTINFTTSYMHAGACVCSCKPRQRQDFYGRPMEYGRPLYFCSVVSFFFFFSLPNLSACRLDVYHTSTHGVALVRI